MSASDLGLDPKLLLRLEQMSLAAKRRTRGTMQGKRRSKQLGASLEFADYRMYAPGDDIRRFDWGAYAVRESRSSSSSWMNRSFR